MTKCIDFILRIRPYVSLSVRKKNDELHPQSYNESRSHQTKDEVINKDESICLNSFNDIGIVEFKSDLDSNDYDTFTALYDSFKEKKME